MNQTQERESKLTKSNLEAVTTATQSFVYPFFITIKSSHLEVYMRDCLVHLLYQNAESNASSFEIPYF